MTEPNKDQPMCIFDEQTNTDLPGEIAGYFDLTAAYEMVREREMLDAHLETCISRETGFDERSLDELMTLDIQDRWRELLADADELIDRETPNG